MNSRCTKRRTASRLALQALLGLGLLLAGGFPAWAQDGDEASSNAPNETAEDEAESAAPGNTPAAPSTERFRAGRTQGLGRPFPRNAVVPASVEAELPAFQDALQAYEEEMNDYRRSITAIIESEYIRRRAEVTSNYGERIDAARLRERDRRDQAIAQFERFLARYPTSPEYTPDAMFRLAELFYDRSTDDYETANQEYARLEDRYLAGIVPDLPDPPEYDYRPTIELFADLARRFPDYRQIDGVFYLTGAAWDRMGEIEEAQVFFRRVGEEYPESEFAQESWLRIGEYHFDFLEYENALAAYTRAEAYGDSRLYDKIVFKLGWSTYLLDEFDAAIGYFRQLLEYYIERESENAVEARDLEEESLQYFAVTLAEEDWDLDGEIDPDFILPRVHHYVDFTRPWAVEVLSRLAARLDTNERILASASIYRLILDTYPLDPLNPRRHDTLVRILGRGNEDAQAVEELTRLSQLYVPGTPWYQEQERLGNIEEMEFADQLVRGGLLESATLVYANAAELANQAAATGDPLVENRAMEQFRVAGRLFGEFLGQYPNVDEAYEVRMYLAQSLYYSLQYEEAAAQYEEVRDSLLEDEYREVAADQAIRAWSLALRREIDAGRLEERALPGYGQIGEVESEAVQQLADDQLDSDTEAREVPTAEPIPELSLRWAAAVERFHELRIRPDEDPDAGIKGLFATGVLFHTHQDYEGARERFIRVLDDCRPIDETGYAAGFIIESFGLTGDVDGLRFWQQELDRRQACVPESLRAALAEDLQQLAMGELAARAERLMREELYEEAAEEYSQLATEYADNREMAPRGLFNAGLIYEQNLSRFEPAIRQFERLVAEYPESEWVEPSLVRIALNARRFFDFDKAIDTFRILDERGFRDEEAEIYPITDMAELLMYSQRRAEAAEAFLEFADRHPNDARTPYSIYVAGTLFGDAGDARRMMSTFERFRRSHGRDRANPYLDIDAAFIDTLARTARYYDENGNTREADNFYRQVLSEFTVRNIAARPTNQAIETRYAAGEAAYRFANRNYADWSEITLGTTVTQQRQAITRKQEGMLDLIDQFSDVAQYQSADWTVCALYMRGRLPDEFTDLLYRLPIPDSLLGNPDLEDQYQFEIDEIANTLVDRAVENWEQAYAVMQGAGVINECTADTTRSLNRLKGSQFPVLMRSYEHTEQRLFNPQRLIPLPSVDDADASDPAGETVRPVSTEPSQSPFDDGAFDEIDDPFGGE